MLWFDAICNSKTFTSLRSNIGKSWHRSPLKSGAVMKLKFIDGVSRTSFFSWHSHILNDEAWKAKFWLFIPSQPKVQAFFFFSRHLLVVEFTLFYVCTGYVDRIRRSYSNSIFSVISLWNYNVFIFIWKLC